MQELNQEKNTAPNDSSAEEEEGSGKIIFTANIPVPKREGVESDAELPDTIEFEVKDYGNCQAIMLANKEEHLRVFGEALGEQGFGCGAYLQLLASFRLQEMGFPSSDSLFENLPNELHILGVCFYPIFIGNNFATRVSADAAIRVIARERVNEERRSKNIQKAMAAVQELIGQECPCSDCEKKRAEKQASKH